MKRRFKRHMALAWIVMLASYVSSGETRTLRHLVRLFRDAIW